MTEGQTLDRRHHARARTVGSVLRDVKPDVVLVHGDTTTSTAAALAAYYQKIPVGHVEAGLRTDTIYEPFPEEINRRLTGVIADLSFRADAARKTQPAARGQRSRQRSSSPATRSSTRSCGCIGASSDGDAVRVTTPRMIFVEAHRRENLGAPMEGICRALAERARRTAGRFDRVAGASEPADRRSRAPVARRKTARAPDRADDVPATRRHDRAVDARRDRLRRTARRSAVSRQAGARVATGHGAAGRFGGGHACASSASTNKTWRAQSDEVLDDGAAYKRMAQADESVRRRQRGATHRGSALGTSARRTHAAQNLMPSSAADVAERGVLSFETATAAQARQPRRGGHDAWSAALVVGLGSGLLVAKYVHWEWAVPVGLLLGFIGGFHFDVPPASARNCERRSSEGRPPLRRTANIQWNSIRPFTGSGDIAQSGGRECRRARHMRSPRTRRSRRWRCLPEVSSGSPTLFHIAGSFDRLVKGGKRYLPFLSIEGVLARACSRGAAPFVIVGRGPWLGYFTYLAGFVAPLAVAILVYRQQIVRAASNRTQPKRKGQRCTRPSASHPLWHISFLPAPFNTVHADTVVITWIGMALVCSSSACWRRPTRSRGSRSATRSWS